MERESVEQMELRALIEKLERQISEKDAAQDDRESSLRAQEERLASEKRKFHNEREILASKIEMERSRLQVILTLCFRLGTAYK